MKPGNKSKLMKVFYYLSNLNLKIEPSLIQFQTDLHLKAYNGFFKILHIGSNLKMTGSIFINI